MIWTEKASNNFGLFCRIFLWWLLLLVENVHVRTGTCQTLFAHVGLRAAVTVASDRYWGSFIR